MASESTGHKARAISARETVKPAQLPVDLRDARLKLSEAVQLLGYSLLALLVGAIGGWLALAATPAAAVDWTKTRAIIALFGASVAIVGVGQAVNVSRLMAASWWRYLDWCDRYADVDIESREASGNQERETEVRIWELSANTPRDVLLVALAVWYQVQQGEAHAYTVRGLTGPLWLGNIRLGDVNTTQAQRTAKALAQVGLIEGRTGTRSGEWTAQSADEVIMRVLENWNRVQG
jgi:hypothetical protein